MIDWEKPIETEEGFPARLLSTDYRFEGKTFMLVQIEYEYRSSTRVFEKNGTPYWSSLGRLRNRKTKREGWVNIYSNTNTHGQIWGTEEEAKTFQTVGSIITTKIEWEE